MLAVLAKHVVASGAGQGEGPAAVSMVEHAHGYEVKRISLVFILQLQDFLFRHNGLLHFFFDRLTAVSTSR